jgi:integral membrane sensor domain MASE1
MILSRKSVRASNVFVGLGSSLGRVLRPYFESRNLAGIAVLTAVYFIVATVAQRPAAPNHLVTAIWLPAGIAVAACLLRGLRVWPAVFIAGLPITVVIIGFSAISVVLTLNSCLEAVVAAYLVKKYANGINAFFKTRDVLRFIFFAAILAPALCATMGSVVFCLGGYTEWSGFPSLWFVWWVGDMLGVLFVTPFLVLLLGHKHRFFGWAEPLEITALIAGLSLMCVLNFGQRPLPWLPANALLFLCAPFLVWSALRFCPLEAAGATLVMGGFTVWGSLHGLGPFENAAGLPLFVGAFLAVGTGITLAIAAASAEQKSATKDVLGAYSALKDVKETEIRVLQDTVEALRVELEKVRHRRASAPPQEGTRSATAADQAF